MGGVGCGKTTSILTIPSDQKALLIDFDGKSDTIKRLKPKNVFIADLYVSPSNYRDRFDKLNAIVDGLENSSQNFEWVFFDSLSTHFKLLGYNSHDYIKGGAAYKLNYDKQDWVKDQFWRTILRTFGAVENTVLIAHEGARMDAEGNSTILPLSIKSLSEEAPTRFQNFFHATTRGGGDDIAYVWETRPSGMYQCNTAISDLPFIVPNHFDFILKTNWSGGKSLDEMVISYEKNHKRKLTKWKITN